MSASVTVGGVDSSDSRKSASFKGGSNNSSEPTSCQVFSTASGSPGEHGVHFVSSGLLDIGSGTRLKCVADMTLRMGCMSASRTTVEISDPEYPSVLSASVRKSLGLSWFGVSPMWISNIRLRASGPGRGIYIRFSNLGKGWPRWIT